MGKWKWRKWCGNTGSPCLGQCLPYTYTARTGAFWVGTAKSALFIDTRRVLVTLFTGLLVVAVQYFLFFPWVPLSVSGSLSISKGRWHEENCFIVSKSGGAVSLALEIGGQ